MKVYIIGPAGSTPHDDHSYGDAAIALRKAGHDVIPLPPCINLRDEVARLAGCDAVCLLDGWWTSTEGHCLQTIAAWLRFKVLSPDGSKVPTMSLRG